MVKHYYIAININHNKNITILINLLFGEQTASKETLLIDW